VDQVIAMVDTDRAAIETAQTNLDYTSILAPSDGRMGVRQEFLPTFNESGYTILMRVRICHSMARVASGSSWKSFAHGCCRGQPPG
jgi:hypothetical protein